MKDQTKLNEISHAEGQSLLNVGLGVTEKMIDDYIEFAKKASYLQHPDVPYYGTVNGDSTEKWERRLVRTALEHVLTHNGERHGNLR